MKGAAKKEYDKQYRLSHSVAVAEYQKKYRLLHREELQTKRKSYFQKYMKSWRAKNKEQISLYNKEYALKNRSSISAKNNHYRKEKKKSDPQFLLKIALRGRLGAALKGNLKTGSAVKDLGCTIPELKFYLEGKFKDGMSWENYGKWHIDHVIPLAFFDLTDREQFLKACHYTNLQPLWALENIKKSNKLLNNYVLNT